MITPVLLCGGSGSRLWPLSRKSYPKQFVQLVGGDTLFQASAKRLSGEGYAAPLIVTNKDFRFIVTEQLVEEGIDPGAVIIEPERLNTGPVVLAAALLQQDLDPDALLLVAPSDHLVPDVEAFRKSVEVAREAALEGKLVTFGIRPDYPETGYGYLELAECIDGKAPRAFELKCFVEKPCLEDARTMVASGAHLWNAGIFLFSVKTIIKAFRDHAPQLVEPVEEAVKHRRMDLGFLRLDPFFWSQAEDISIDYAVMEKADNLAVVPFTSDWSDLGGWDAVWRESEKDEDGVATSGPVTAIECRNTLLRSEDETLELVGIGLENLVAIAMPDAVLVANTNRAQDVRRAVDALKAKRAEQAEDFALEHRPWGWYERLVVGQRFQVNRIVVHPGASMSLQSHHHRAEHWIVVEGTARITLDEETSLLAENQSVYIPLGVVHRLENPGKLPAVLIEVQTGSYLGEDDIIRFEDLYHRA
ncbi:mannose-1-phosphate guanylyltransferase/mannose-6-phosphate isomerase [uncultured Cohaesibacter sp.]|uniref:mannose-1-phosphate guanylyltransferase/mannose-6-phosphate isomerase n=1 Tax=uncultured Cohaesibacter sp. TaxID=1002546 RepID=UPI0029C93F0F|nr:mannose-1-phosphate guanylyltransferase/mannose-6-phosphate isomerase [uncultured Cohaesibacter sp.]